MIFKYAIGLYKRRVEAEALLRLSLPMKRDYFDVRTDKRLEPRYYDLEDSRRLKKSEAVKLIYDALIIYPITSENLQKEYRVREIDSAFLINMFIHYGLPLM